MWFTETQCVHFLFFSDQMVSIRRESGVKNPAEMTYYVQHAGAPLSGASAAKVLNTVDSQTMALTLGYFVQLQAEREQGIVLADKQKRWQTDTSCETHVSRGVHSEELALGWRQRKKSLRKLLCSLFSLKCSRQDFVCLGCRAAHCYVEGGGGQERVGEREHAASSYRLLTTIAESGSVYYQVVLRAVSLSVGVTDASVCFSRRKTVFLPGQ